MSYSGNEEADTVVSVPDSSDHLIGVHGGQVVLYTGWSMNIPMPPDVARQIAAGLIAAAEKAEPNVGEDLRCYCGMVMYEMDGGRWRHGHPGYTGPIPRHVPRPWREGDPEPKIDRYPPHGRNMTI